MKREEMGVVLDSSLRVEMIFFLEWKGNEMNRWVCEHSDCLEKKDGTVYYPRLPLSTMFTF